jgi:hypothetical protein
MDDQSILLGTMKQHTHTHASPAISSGRPRSRIIHPSVADDLEPVVRNVGVAVVVVGGAGGRHRVPAEGAFLLLVLRVVAHAHAARTWASRPRTRRRPPTAAAPARTPTPSPAPPTRAVPWQLCCELDRSDRVFDLGKVIGGGRELAIRLGGC